MNPEKYIENLQNALQRRFRAAGHGSIRRVQETLGLGAGYFKDQRRPNRRRVDLRVLFRALEELEVDPADFFADALGQADVLVGFTGEGAALRARTQRLPRIFELVEERCRHPVRTEPASGVAGGDDFDGEAFDELAFDNPRQAIRRAHLLAPQVRRRHLPRLLGITASAYLMSDRGEIAQIVLTQALELAPAMDAGLRGDLLRRAAAIVAQRGDHERALSLLEQAILAFVKAADLPGVGQAMIDQGNRLADLGQWRRAISAFQGALEYLADREPKVAEIRFRCLVSLTECHLRLGELERALSFGERADERSEGMAPALRGELAWLLSTIALRQQAWPQAERYLRRVVAVDCPEAPLDGARATVELVRVLLIAGRTAEAYDTAKSLTLSVQALRRDPPASAAITELVRHALTGRGLTLAVVGKVADRLDRLRGGGSRKALRRP